MTKSEALDLVRSSKIYVNGQSEKIQKILFSIGVTWRDGTTELMHSDLPFLYIDGDCYLYGVKSMNYFNMCTYKELLAETILTIDVPTYRPFNDNNECWNEMLKHKPFGWIKHGNKFTQIRCLKDDNRVVIGGNKSEYYYNSMVMNGYKFADGTPFGVEISEK